MHNLEIGSRGQVAFATRAEPAWHMLGHVFDEDEAVSTTDMLRKARLLGWNVRDEPLVARIDEEDIVVPDQNVILRDNPFYEDDPDNEEPVNALAVVGDRYRVVQNEDAFSFGDTLLDGGGVWETAGSIDLGRKVFGSLLIDRDVVLDPEGVNDLTRTYLLISTSHDGSLAIQASITPVRVVCQNTLTVALGNISQSFKMRHTQSIDGRIAEARKALNLTFTYMDNFEAEAKELFETELTNQDFVNLVKNLYPKPENDSKAALTRWENKVDLLGDIWNGSVDDAPDTMSGITGTAWGAFNTLIEAQDWYRTPKNGNVDSVAAAASGFNPVVQTEKNRIYSNTKALAASK